MDYKTRITIEPGKRGGKPCIRSMRITVYDVLDMLAQGMSQAEIIEDFPELKEDDIYAVLAFPPHIIWLRLGNSRVSRAEEALVKHKDKISSIIEENITGIIEIN